MIKIISSDRYRDLRKSVKKLAEIEDLCKHLEDTVEAAHNEMSSLQRETKAARRENMVVYGLFFVICILCVVIIENKRGGLF